MKNGTAINKKLFDILLLFTREPFVQYFTKELEFYTNKSGGLIGLISLDLTDNDYFTCILSRDATKQYRAELIEASIPTIKEARDWIDEKMGSTTISFHNNLNGFFDLFQNLNNEDRQHPNYRLLRDHVTLSAAKEALQEVSYHYKDIDGNFIDQFQSLNGFDSRVWELFLFCFFREQYFSFKRNYESPDYMIDRLGEEVAVEAVIVSRKTELGTFGPKEQEQIQEKLENEVPLLYGSALFDKMKKKYWEKEHVKGKPFVIAIADFHDTMSMTWTFNAIQEYLYGYKYTHSFDENGKIVVTSVKIDDYTKANGTKIPSGFFSLPDSENVSAVIFSSCGTLSKFNRMGKQAGLGSKVPILIRTGTFYNHEPNADKPHMITYQVEEDSPETWSEGVMVFHNPNAVIKLNPNLFDDRVAQCFFENELIYSFMPEIFPYSSFTQNLIPKDYVDMAGSSRENI